MDNTDYVIYRRLRENSQTMYVTPDKKKAYYLIGEEMHVLLGNFSGKTQDEIKALLDTI